MIFNRLRIANWRQFSTVDIALHSNLTIITGANGAGKSTILNILGQHFGQYRPYLSMPVSVNGRRTFFPGIFSIPDRVLSWIKRKTDQNWSNVGSISYSNNENADIQVPTQGQNSYNIQLAGQQPVIGFHMPSHRIMPQYQQIQSVSFGGLNPSTSYNAMLNENNHYFHGNNSGYSVLFRLKELLATWSVFGEGNSVLGRKDDQAAAYSGFSEILHRLLPSDLGFRRLKIDPPDVIFETDTGDFLIDALSGGLTAIIEMAALIYTRSLADDVVGQPFVVTMDEPENHLHPAMQRTILSSLVSAFPKVQFIVATHSPFIVASSKNSLVYALRYTSVSIAAEEASSEESRQAVQPMKPQESRRVECIPLGSGNLGTSPGEILRDVLGVSVTMPIWAEHSIEHIVAQYRNRPFNRATLDSLKSDIDEAGLTDLFPDAVLHLGQTN